ncbi:putative beta-lactamase [Lyophyllum shimeji]|uniref:Beta-lactamase n=1 Tax=Lyophyllum shimeji TaxID=47721 RepID=A0A9P3PPC7_LYOSH|nr:putative beta-lactamase [Lyophyllum shimeji]
MRLLSLLSLVPYYLAWDTLAGLPQALSQETGANITSIIDADTEAFINQVLADWKSPGGVAVAFVKRDDNGTWTNIETKGFGRATASGTNVTENTMFNIGSNSKLFTVLATSLLINNETLSPRLNWDSKVKDFIMQFNLTDPVATAEATPLDLMSHRSGYPLHDFSYRYSDDVPMVLYKMQFLRQSAQFRDIWQYNNNMYTTLSYFPPLLLPSKQPFARYVKEHILDPLGMNQTTYDYNLANSNGQRADGMAREGLDVYKDPFAGTSRAAQYWTSKTGGEDGSVLAGAGGVITCAVDVAKWLQMLLLDGVNPANNQTVIPPGVLKKIASAIIPQTGAPDWPEYSLYAYGAAQLQITYRGHLIIEHGGFIRGFNTQISRLPYDNFGVSVLTNDNEYGKVIGEIIKNHIIDKTLGLEPIDWNSRWKALKSIAPTRATPRPENVTLPSTNFTKLAGTYNNEGYGKIELCLLAPEDPNPTASCRDLAANVSTILPGAVRSGIPILVGAVDSPWFSHIAVEHFNADLFNVSLFISTPTNDSSQPYWTYNDKRQSDNGMIGEADVEGDKVAFGLAGFWAGLWDGAAAGVPKPTGNTVRERAEVYFEKI